MDVDGKKVNKNEQGVTNAAAKALEKQTKFSKTVSETVKMNSSVNDAIKRTTAAISESVASNYVTLFSDVIRSITETMVAVYKVVAENMPRIELPQISISPELIDAFKRVSYLALYKRANWPLFLVDAPELREVMDVYLHDEEPDPVLFSKSVIEYFDQEGIEVITDDWKNSPCLVEERRRILSEVVDLYNAGFFYGCVTTCMCQLSGIINDSFDELEKAGKNFDVNTVNHIYEFYNGGSSLDKGIVKRIENKAGKRITEKIQLLCLISDVDSATLYWEAGIDYLYNTVLAKDGMTKDNHSCRNPICHGTQLNYGDKEHAIKAILSVDIALGLAEMLYISNIIKESADLPS